MSPSRQSALEVSGFFGTLTVIVLVLELMLALWIRGIVFTAGLFSLMSAFFGTATLASYVLNRRAAKRGAERSSERRAAVGAVLLIALVSSACIALLAGIFALPLLFNGGWRETRPEWRIPAVLGLNRTHDGQMLPALTYQGSGTEPGSKQQTLLHPETSRT